MPLGPCRDLRNVGLDNGQDAIGVGAASYWRGHHARHRRDRRGFPEFFGSAVATVTDVGAIE